MGVGAIMRPQTPTSGAEEGGEAQGFPEIEKYRCVFTGVTCVVVLL